jgi:hypothetical protein
VSVSFYFTILGELLFLFSQKKRRPASTTLPRVGCDARQKLEGLKLAVLKPSGPLIGFCLLYPLSIFMSCNGIFF